MAEISKQDADFIDLQEEKLKKALNIDETGLDLISASVPSVANLDPGDVATFSYNGKTFMSIAVSNARTGASSAVFTNTRTKNKLSSCFLVDHLSSESLKILISSLDKYREYAKVASYRYIVTLFGMYIGRDKYRTFISTGNRMSSLVRISARENQ